MSDKPASMVRSLEDPLPHLSHRSHGALTYDPAMPVLLRVLRGAMAVATIVALIVTFADGTDEPGFNAVNFFSYFTVLSNIGAITVLGALFLRPDLIADRRFVNYRGAITLYMAITGVVYNVLLAPAAANVGVDQEWTNSVVHVIGPAVIVVDWFLDRAPLRSTVVETASWLIFPAVWLVYTMIRGPMADWYPYPFLDPDLKSIGSIVITCVGIMVTFVVFAFVLRLGGRDGESGGRQPVPAI